MLMPLWRRMRKNDSASLPRNELSKGRGPTFRPQLEALEDRRLPAPLSYGVLSLNPPGINSPTVAPHLRRQGSKGESGALGGLQPMGSQSAGAAVGEMDVTVQENSPKTVIDLGYVFAQMNGIQHDDGLQLSLLGNTNPALVKTDLSEDELSLTYTPSMCGTATISVGATDADGVSVRENILVTVLPVPSTSTGGSSSVSGTGNA
jgi:hypothetical protein